MLDPILPEIKMRQPADLRYLIVDGFSTIRRIVCGLLSEIGAANTEGVEDGEEALQKLKNARYDIVVIGSRTPKMGGLDLLKAIKADPMLEHIPVLMIFPKAQARKEDILLAAQSGVAGYLVKPFTKAILEDKVLKILNRVEATSECSLTARRNVI